MYLGGGGKGISPQTWGVSQWGNAKTDLLGEGDITDGRKSQAPPPGERKITDRLTIAKKRKAPVGKKQKKIQEFKDTLCKSPPTPKTIGQKLAFVGDLNGSLFKARSPKTAG